MLQARGSGRHLVLFVLAMLVPARGAEVSVDDLVEAMASRLERTQVLDGPAMGSWASEEMFTGSMTSGLASAYEWTSEISYRMAANWGGYFILGIADPQGNLLGDEAYALVRLGEIFPEAPGGVWTWNVWAQAVKAFYESPRLPGYETTAGYLAYFDHDEPSTATYFMAHHVVAVYHADDIDKELWRDALIKHLSRVDDTANFPVMALGAATWALATVGALDDTPVASEGSAAYWDGVVLNDLPALLLGHQVPEGAPFAGSFYWRLDHTAGGTEGVVAGYTEDAIYGAMGLVAAAQASEDPAAKEELEVGIASAHQILIEGVDTDGKVYEHLAREGAAYHAFAGEMLQVLWSTKTYWDAQEDLDAAAESDGAVSSEAGV
jgi:hypothetical protein